MVKKALVIISVLISAILGFSFFVLMLGVIINSTKEDFSPIVVYAIALLFTLLVACILVFRWGIKWLDKKPIKTDSIDDIGKTST